MAPLMGIIVDIACGQEVRIPALQLTDGQEFRGTITSSDGEMLIIELEGASGGAVPIKIDQVLVMTWNTDGIQRACPILVRSRQPRTLSVRVVIQERREAPRVRADMQLAYEVIAAEQVKEIADEVMAKVNTLSEPESEAFQLLRKDDDPLAELRQDMHDLRQMLGELMAKVDDLTGIVSGTKPPSARGRILQPVTILNCSSTGVGFLAREPHAEGEYLRMRITLRTTPQAVIDCMGVVMRASPCERPASESGSPPHDIGVRFTHIHEADRERMIHYLFKVQRRILRDLKEARTNQD
jgi:hypothetical protein